MDIGQIQTLESVFSDDDCLDYIYSELVKIGENYLQGEKNEDKKNMLLQELDWLEDELVSKFKKVTSLYNKVKKH